MSFSSLSHCIINLFKDIFFCFILFRLAVRISLPFNCTDPGLQLGDPALLIGFILLWRKIMTIFHETLTRKIIRFTILPKGYICAFVECKPNASS